MNVLFIGGPYNGRWVDIQHNSRVHYVSTGDFKQVEYFREFLAEEDRLTNKVSKYTIYRYRDENTPIATILNNYKKDKKTEKLLAAAIDYINKSPCDPDHTKEQWEAYRNYMELLEVLENVN